MTLTLCRWRSMQNPEQLSSSMEETYFNKWLESVRKDVQCAFGCGKQRFRCLRLPFLFKRRKDIENIFITCCSCMLHNMMLDEKLDVDGGWSRDEAPPPRYWHPLTRRTDRATDTTDFSRPRPRQHGQPQADGPHPMDAVTPRETDSEWLSRRARLITHFNYIRTTKQLKWNGPKEYNPSLHIPLKNIV